MTARTSLNLSSIEKTGGRANGSSLHEEPDITTLPDFVKRDKRWQRIQKQRGSKIADITVARTIAGRALNVLRDLPEAA